ncbi:uncharacterized protein LOC122263473 [Penaeus japonicus]|uniref:uncharacterized protein LOC122263473 n=1 Tax=Penaeus japonicus TaxID=27405 RepID=UPI001C714E3B|nr:uncharacterized protein LOC122263473 [Penaeus japonicus]
MAMGMGGESILVKLSGVIRFCCEPQEVPRPSQNPVLPPGYHRGQVVEEPHVITDPDTQPWDLLLQNHRLRERPRYTIIPTISVVPPWDDLDHNALHDQVVADSQQIARFITPTPVLPLPRPAPSLVGEVARNATQRFYDALRAVLHGGEQGPLPSLSNGGVGGADAAVAGLAPHVQDTSEPYLTSRQANDDSQGMSPILQVCAALGVLVVVMMILFHSHHFRRDCMVERRALRRVARRYHVARAHDDVERSEVTDVTL